MWFRFCKNIVWFKGLIGLDAIVYKHSTYITCEMKAFLKNTFKRFKLVRSPFYDHFITLLNAFNQKFIFVSIILQTYLF